MKNVASAFEQLGLEPAQAKAVADGVEALDWAKVFEFLKKYGPTILALVATLFKIPIPPLPIKDGKRPDQL